jgi:hypothetical protein
MGFQMRLAWLVVVGLVVAVPARAEYYTGQALFEACQSDRGLCLGYVIATADAMVKSPVADLRACIPKTVSSGQVRDVAFQYLTANPQERHFSASSLVAVAIGTAFPCRARGINRP